MSACKPAECERGLNYWSISKYSEKAKNNMIFEHLQWNYYPLINIFKIAEYKNPKDIKFIFYNRYIKKIIIF